MRYKAGMFTVVPNLSKLHGLPPQAQTLFLWMCNFAGSTGECFPSVKTLENCTGMTDRSVQKWLPFLEEKGLLKVEEEWGRAGERKSNRYFLEISESVEIDPPKNFRGDGEEFSGGWKNDEGVKNFRGHQKGTERQSEIPPENSSGELKEIDIYNNKLSKDNCAKAQAIPQNFSEKVLETEAENETEEIFEEDFCENGEEKEKSSEKKEKIDRRNTEISAMLEVLKKACGVDDFREDRKWQRLWGKNLVELAKKIGKEIFIRRIEIFLKDDFKRKNRNSLKYLYSELKSMPDEAITPFGKSSSVFTFLPRK